MEKTVDVESIMSKIREDIVNNGRDKEPLNFIDLEAAEDKGKTNNDLEEAVDYISCNYEVQPYEVLRGNKIAVFFKRCIRKVTGFFILPIVRQQNTLNYYYYRISETIVDVKNDNEDLKKRADLLEKRISELERKAAR